MRDFFEKIPVFVILMIVVSVIRAIMRAGKKGSAGTRTENGVEETDDQRRVREIQERIRRIAAERRGQPAPVSPPPLHAPQPTLARPTVPPIDPFGGPEERGARELLRRLQPKPEPVTPPPVPRSNTAELERQARLQEELRALEERKFLAQRQAQHVAEEKLAVAESETGRRTTARTELLADLREPSSLRRALVLREVLGAPVGLR